jgi:hypothetical protein
MATSARTAPSPSGRCFDFITSRYANFHHHLGSFDGQPFDAPHVLGATDVGSALPSAFTTPTTVDSDAPVPAGGVPLAEQRAFVALETVALGPTALRSPERVELLNVFNDSTTTGFLVRSPEPIRWERTELFVETSGEAAGASTAADVALTGVAFSGGAANQETVTVLVREPADLTGYQLQWRPIPDPAGPGLDPEWTDHFVFGTETPLAAGTQVRIHSGPPEEIAHDVGIVLRFASTSGFAQPQFPAAGVELRLLTPTGDVAHQRSFLPDGSFAILATRIVRKGDGTAFFLFVPGTTGSVRLNLAYVRAVILPLPANRQGGSEVAERIALVAPLG